MRSFRYVALNTLNKVALSDNAVQRHRDVVLSCLSDGDVSIRRRALELSYALINDQNIRIMMRELLAFLEVADNEFKTGLTTQISLAAERYAPNRRWHIDTVLRTLSLVSRVRVCLLYEVFLTHLVGFAGRQLCPRGGARGFHSPGLSYSGTSGVHGTTTIPSTT